ncbi:hypothetical protein MWU59_04520 [Flavobacteriaceae bacterium F08102]|nr:hypothetical protein [Flavobacteriaceae bacterium F08102]
MKNSIIHVTDRKDLYFIAVLFLLAGYGGFAQSPNSFNYQAAVRDAGGLVLSNQEVTMRMSLIQGTVSGPIVYSETFTPTTNDYGLVAISIGTGTVLQGDFSTVDWGNGPYFLETAVDPNGGTNYSIIGTSQLLSVPYALYAQNAGGQYWEEEDYGILYKGGNVQVGSGNAIIDPFVKFQIRSNDSDESATNLRLLNENPAGVTKMLFTTDGPDYFSFGVGINNTNSPFGSNEGFIWQFEDHDIKFGTNDTERLRIKNSGDIIVKTSDIFIENVGSGVIMKSPDGNCWRMTVDNNGNPVFQSISCPN